MKRASMSGSTKKFNYVKWGFIVALVGCIATILTVPEFRCSIGLLADTCAIPQKEIELITQAETGEALAGVKVQVIARGAPENQFTDDNGYAKVKIGTKGDVRINLSKSGYPVQDFNINLANDQNTVRIIRLAKSGQPEVSSSSTIPSPKPTQTPTQTPSETALPEDILSQKCQEGVAPKTILIPKERYLEGEFITIKFANACPDKTVIVVKKAGSPTTGMNTGQRRQSELVRKYAGELTFSYNAHRAGSYEIQAYFSPNGSSHFISGISDKFDIVSRF